MPLISYGRHRFSDEKMRIVEQLVEILTEYADRGFQLTLRQVYYQFIARDLFPASWQDPSTGSTNNERSYKKLGDIVANARDSGRIDWDHIVDRAREVQSKSHWASPRDIIETCSRAFNLDLWEDQPYRVEVWAEKQALEQVIARAAVPLDVPYLSNKGYISASAIWAAGHERVLPYIRNGQNVLILHLGDHDPSGIDMTRDVEARLRKYSRCNDDRLEVRRIALNMDQVREYNPPPNPAKQTDARIRSYRSEFGDDCWELDALDPQVIVDLVDEQIRSVMDESAYEAAVARQDRCRNEILAISTDYDRVVEMLDEFNSEEED